MTHGKLISPKLSTSIVFATLGVVFSIIHIRFLNLTWPNDYILNFNFGINFLFAVTLVAIAISLFLLTSIRVRRHLREAECLIRRAPLTGFQAIGLASMCAFLCFNLLILQIPSLPYIFSAPPPTEQFKDLSHFFSFRFMDAVRSYENPLIRLIYWLPIPNDSYLFPHLVGAFIGSISLGFLVLGLSKHLGSIALFVFTVLTCTDPWFVRLVLNGSNLVSALLPTSLGLLAALWFGDSSVVTRKRRNAAYFGLLSGVAVIVSLYSYQAARFPGGLLSFFGLFLFVSKKKRFYGIFVAPLIALGVSILVVSGWIVFVRGWNLVEATKALQSVSLNVPQPLLSEKPTSIDVSETISPDLPLWIGLRAHFPVAGKARDVAWIRSLPELFETTQIHLQRCLNALMANSRIVALFLFSSVVGLVIILMVRPILVLWYFIGVLACSTSYVIVGSPFEFRRAAPLSLLLFLPIAIVITTFICGNFRLVFKKGSGLFLLVLLLPCVIFKLTESKKVALEYGVNFNIQLPCAYLPVSALLRAFGLPERSDPRVAGLTFAGQVGVSRCVHTFLDSPEGKRIIPGGREIAIRDTDDLVKAAQESLVVMNCSDVSSEQVVCLNAVNEGIGCRIIGAELHAESSELWVFAADPKNLDSVSGENCISGQIGSSSKST